MLLARIGQIQIVDHDRWAAKAQTQRSAAPVLPQKRGRILIHDRSAEGGVLPLAVNREYAFVFAVPDRVDDAARTARLLAALLEIPEDRLRAALSKRDDPWEPLKHRVDPKTASAVRALQLPGIETSPEPLRYYPEGRLASHVVGFVSAAEDAARGQYGIEHAFESVLAGSPADEKSGGATRALATDGADIVLTIDRQIQHTACEALRVSVESHHATGGSVIIMEPATGAIRALCNMPDFDPNAYNAVDDQSQFTNSAILRSYEPGSIFKPITMAAGLETNAVLPETTYTDPGRLQFGKFEIKNSDGKAHGVTTMVNVLAESLNTGAAWVAEKVGAATFRNIVEQFGFGAPTGIDLPNEVGGDLRSLEKRGEIYTATASFGQGITTTPLQMVAAYGAIANGGVLMRPMIVDEIRYPDGRRDVQKPQAVRRVVSDRTATLLSGMLVAVVQGSHGRRAAVPGYTVAGKTGTAQIAKIDGPGYEADLTIGSFAGFAPVENPAFVMLTKVDRPTDVRFAESTAAPLFGELAKFLLRYYNRSPDAPLR